MDELSSERLLRVPDVAKWLGVHPYTVYRMAGDGIIPGKKIGKSWRFKKDELERFASGVLRSDDSGEGDRDGSKAGDVRKN